MLCQLNPQKIRLILWWDIYEGTKNLTTRRSKWTFFSLLDYVLNLFIARNQGHYEPANDYQRYSVLHSGTIVYQENSIWRRSRLDLQSSVFRTTTYTIWAPHIFYLMKRKSKFQDFDLPLLNFRAKMTEFAFNAWHIFIPKRTWELIYLPART